MWFITEFLLCHRLCVKCSQLLIHHCVVPLLPQEKAYIQYPRFRYATSKREAISVSLRYAPTVIILHFWRFYKRTRISQKPIDKRETKVYN